MKRLAIALVSAAALAAALAPTASASGHCGGIQHQKVFYEARVRIDTFDAYGSMNCASARYAASRLWQRMRQSNYRTPSTFNDGYVQWYRTTVRKIRDTGNGCGTTGWVVRYREYESNTSFDFILDWSGC